MGIPDRFSAQITNADFLVFAIMSCLKKRFANVDAALNSTNFSFWLLAWTNSIKLSAKQSEVLNLLLKNLTTAIPAAPNGYFSADQFYSVGSEGHLVFSKRIQNRISRLKIRIGRNVPRVSKGAPLNYPLREQWVNILKALEAK